MASRKERSVGIQRGERKGPCLECMDPCLRDAGLRATLACMPPVRADTRIRRATGADLEPLLALEEATFDSDRISRAQWRRHIASRSAAVLVGGRPGAVDAAAVVFYRRHTRVARLYSLAVGAHARGTGLGGALLDAAESDARTRGCTSLQLEVRTDNAVALALYERRGYARLARLPHFYEDGADAWRCAKQLTPVIP